MKKYITFFLLGLSFHVNGQIITTVAGNCSSVRHGYSGDGGPATDAILFQPIGIAIDKNDNIFFADNSDNCVRKIDTMGIISTIAGEDSSGYSGDGGPAIYAKLSQPWGVAFDKNGYLYISDAGNNAIRRVDTSGLISTIAGNGIAIFGGDGGPASTATFNQISNISIDHLGRIYVSGDNRIRRIDTNGIINTFAGNGAIVYSGDNILATSASLYDPLGMAIDGDGNIYICDIGHGRIRKVSTSGFITTVAGCDSFGYYGDGGPATNARLRSPFDVKLDTNGDIYIADEANSNVRRVTSDGIIHTIAGMYGVSCTGNFGDNGLSCLSCLWGSNGLAFDGKWNLYITDRDLSVIRKISNATSLDDTGCNITASVTIVKNTEDEIQVFPNPNHGHFTIALISNRNVQVSVVITNVLGEKIKQLDIQTNQKNDMDIAVPRGVYFISGNSGNNKWNSKVFVD